MTIAIAVKVHDGIVLAADSAATLGGVPGPGGLMQAAFIYNNANKIFNLVKGLPIGGMVCGSGNIGPSSMATIAKDLRQKMKSPNAPGENWHVDPGGYTIESVGQKVKAFLEERIAASPGQKPEGAFFVCGYSTGSPLAECWALELKAGLVQPPRRVDSPPESGFCFAAGQPEAFHRLVLGIPSGLKDALVEKLTETGVGAAEVDARAEEWITRVRERAGVSVIPPAMPIQDAIDLAEFLAKTSCGFSRFTPGATTIGGPIDIAAITKHEGFKWVQRKHYFPKKFNPPLQ